MIEIQDASPADATAIAALAIQVFLGTYASQGVRTDHAREAFHEYSEHAFSRRLAEADRKFVLAMDGDALVGFAEVLVSDRRSPMDAVSGAELVRLYVQPRSQGDGVGRRLISRAESLAAAHSVSCLWLTAWDGNANALAFYRRMGYADVGATTYSFQGNTYGNRVLAKGVAAGPAAGKLR